MQVFYLDNDHDAIGAWTYHPSVAWINHGFLGNFKSALRGGNSLVVIYWTRADGDQVGWACLSLGGRPLIPIDQGLLRKLKS